MAPFPLSLNFSFRTVLPEATTVFFSFFTDIAFSLFFRLTLTGGTETILTERLGKINTWQTLYGKH